jgi:hypothetical protein
MIAGYPYDPRRIRIFTPDERAIGPPFSRAAHDADTGG